eukprot:CAMPEP_0194312824 /NCGR_PEP_ID=MMETSP0171-20130528/9759_1 /TAXON_ID=218684 /ORGANISM="Corethron pennatum, Strain L29A3" /LENGTH=317 /DNA_ID=CAMNT_0039067521 /DNA_START=53 /DNA_END=1002 /DNA_ORIENTATION=-
MAALHQPIEFYNSIGSPSVYLDKTHVSKCISAGAAACVSCSLFNPLDCLRVRWQVAPAKEGFLRYGEAIIRNEGVLEGLWRPGLGANVTGMCLSAAIRFGSYETVRDYLMAASASENSSFSKNARDDKQWSHILGSGLICGATGYWLTAPFHSLKTRQQANMGLTGSSGAASSLRSVDGAYIANRRTAVAGVISELQITMRKNGVFGLWKGAMPLTARGALFTAGQMIGYDGLKTCSKSYGVRDGPYLHLAASIAASFCASAMSAPADLMTARFITSGMTLSQCAREIYHVGGVAGFWRGWTLSFVRLTPVMLTFST